MSTLAVTLTGIAPATLTIELGTPGPQGPTGPQGPQGPTGPNAAWGNITGTLSNQTDLQTALNLKAPLASPGLTGVPTAPTAATLTSTTQLATTAFVQQELLSGTANAKNLEVYVRNQTGATLTAGSIVYINGATGNRPTVTKAQANNDANSAQTFGFTKASIANNGFGFVIVRGELENIDTSALTEGVQLYLSPTTAGTWTTTKPSAPQHLVYVGICVRAHPTQGVILVAVQNGYELNELHDVQITSPTNGQVLSYDSVSTLWKNTAVSAPVTSVAGKTGAVTLVVGDVSGAAPLASPALSGNPTAPTPLTADNDTSIATTAFVKAQGYITSAPVTSVAGRTGAITLSNTDISGLGTMATATATDYLSKAGNLSGLASTSTSRSNLGLGTISTVNDAPSDGSTYGRQNGAWVVAGGGGGSVAWGGITGTLSDQMDLQSSLNGKASLSGATFSGAVNTPSVPVNDSQVRVLNAYSSEMFNGMNLADYIALQISNFGGTFYPSDDSNPPEYPDSQTITFDICCVGGLNNLVAFCANNGGVVVIQAANPGFEVNWSVSSFSTSNSFSVNNNLFYGKSYDFYVKVNYVFPNGSLLEQRSRFKVYNYSP